MAGHSIHWLFWKEEVGGTKSFEKEEPQEGLWTAISRPAGPIDGRREGGMEGKEG